MSGASTREASDAAGYSGRATYNARRLWERVEMLLADMDSCPTVAQLERDIERKIARIERLQDDMRADCEWLRAVRIAMGGR